MVLTRTDENELLTALYAGLFQEMPWRLFLTRLRARTEADVCRLFIRPAGVVEWRPTDTVEARSPDTESFAPEPPVFEDLRGGRVYAGDELPGRVDGRARHIRVLWSGGGDLALSLLRRKGDFRARDASVLASLAPHLAIALRGRMELEGERRRAAVADHVLAGFADGWLLLDRRGRVLDTDSVASLMLEAGTMARRGADGRIRFFSSEAELLLEEVMALQEMPTEPRGAWLHIDPPVQMLIARPPETMGASLAAAHCLIVIRRMAGGGAADGRFLPSLFRLTRSETSLAEWIAGGANLVEAAEAMGITIETARNYSKRIYVKTGARGQADLVRIVLEGVRVPR
ncbi:MAG TPA: helix-turn-helix transcriptional regulator [Sphingobium sp.]